MSLKKKMFAVHGSLAYNHKCVYLNERIVLDIPMNSWTIDQVGDWLKANGFEIYIKTFIGKEFL
jgi:hypothetical protein